MNEILVIDSIIDRYKEIKNNIKLIQNDETLYLKLDSIFTFEEDFLFFKENSIAFHGKEFFDSIQNSMINILLKNLKNILSIENVVYKKKSEENISFLSIEIIIDNLNYEIIRINPYFKNIYIIEYNEEENLIEEIEQVENNIKELTNYEKKLYLMKKKPIYSATSPKDMISIAFNKKNRLKKILDEIQKNSNKIQRDKEYIKQLNSLLCQIKNTKSILIEYTNEIIDLLRKYNFNLI